MRTFLRRLFNLLSEPTAEATPNPMKFLVVGLGNPGDKYAETRHNIGFKVIESLAGDWQNVSHGQLARIKHRGKQVLLLKPDTFMNLSGKAVRYWLQKEGIPKENLLVVVDDLHLDFANIRLRGKGADAGHNGLKSIDQLNDGNKYARLRCGIGRDFHPGEQANYVLSEWTETERKGLPDLVKTAGEMVLSFCGHGLQNTMSKFNNKPKKEKEAKPSDGNKEVGTPKAE